MPKLHDETYRTAVQNRIRQLRADSKPRWGKMSVRQMLWHVNAALEGALDPEKIGPVKTPLPKPLMKFMVINLPWPKGAPTLPAWRPQGDSYDFATERDRCLRLIDEFAARRLDGEWPSSPTLGRMTGDEVTRLQAKHLDHHLRQFGV